MSERTVISFLGNVPRSGRYNPVTYRFPEHEGASAADPTSSFVGALVEWLKGNKRPVGRLAIGGTPTSMWSTLANLADDGAIDLDLLIEVGDAERSEEGVGAGQLERLENALAAATGLEVRLLLLGACREYAEQLRVLRSLAEIAAPNDALVVDVTHSFRHLPLIGVAAAHYLEHTRGCRLEGVYYGMFNAPGEPAGTAPVVNVAGMLRILQVGEAFATYQGTGALGPLGEALSKQLPELEEAAFFLDTSQVGKARRLCERALERIDRKELGDTSPLLSVARDELRASLEWALASHSHGGRQLTVALRAISCGAWVTAALMLYESAVSFISRGETDYDKRQREVKARKKAWKRKATDARSKAVDAGSAHRTAPLEGFSSDWAHFLDLVDLRNAVAHGARPFRKSSQRALRTAPSMRARLESLAKWVETSLAPAA
jgi:CRISPR-associated Csx2 family protein